VSSVSNVLLAGRRQGVNTVTSRAIPATSERIRIAFLVRGLNIGGAQRQLMALARSLDKTGFNVTVLTLYSGGPLLHDLHGTGVRVIPLYKKGRWDLIGFFLRLGNVCRNLRPDLLHSYLPGQNVISALLKPLLPQINIVGGIRSAGHDPIEHDWVSMLTFRIQSLLSPFADLIIFNSDAGQRFHVARGVAASRTIVIHNGIDILRFSDDKRRGLKLRSSWQVPEGALLIGVVGRIVPVKDHATFLRAVSILAHSRPEAKFVCIGSGPQKYVRILHDLAVELGLEKKIIWPGELIEDLCNAYNAIDIYCSSSQAEGTSNAILEAMACGVPCVVTDVGDSRAIVGDTGVVVRSCNPLALADGLEQMARRLAQDPQLGLAARQRVVARFSLDSLAQNTELALISTLSNHAA
jgi:glycosyltransferase involved in cell wall biosynthesis